MSEFRVLNENFDRFFISDEEADDFFGSAIYGWGNNAVGQLGNSSTFNRSSPVTTTFNVNNNWKQIDINSRVVTSVKTDGTLWTWGDGADGALGSNATVSRTSPQTTVAGGTDWAKISTSSAIKTNGTLWTWGSNIYGRLGSNDTVDRSSPQTTIAGGTDWQQVSSGISSIAALKNNGTLWTWGRNSFGQLGSNNTTNRSSPQTTVAGGLTWKTISSSSGVNMAGITSAGNLYTWGYNDVGQLGSNNITNRSSPQTTVAGANNWRQISISEQTAAIKNDGTLWTWGGNVFGTLGSNNTTNRSSPQTTVAGGTDWQQVVALDDSTHALKTNGRIFSWGSGSSGALGNNSVLNRSSPVSITYGNLSFKSLAKGHGSTLGNTMFALTDEYYSL